MPVVVGAELYDLQREGLHSKKWDVTDLVILLQSKTVLLNWMQHPSYDQILPRVNRVVLHIEQLSVKHKHSKHFVVELGRLCKCMHCKAITATCAQRASGPVFNIGQNIINTCKLQPVVYESTSRKRLSSGSVAKSSVKNHEWHKELYYLMLSQIAVRTLILLYL